jgi:hypothetical protein
MPESTEETKQLRNKQLRNKQRRARIKIAEAAERDRHWEGIKYKWEEKGRNDKQEIAETERRRWMIELESWKKYSKTLELRTFASGEESMRLGQDSEEETPLKSDKRDVERISLIDGYHSTGLRAVPASDDRIDHTL